MPVFIRKSMISLRKHYSVQWIDPQGILPESPVILHPIEIYIAPDDPILTYFTSASAMVKVDRLQLEYPGLAQMKSKCAACCFGSFRV